MTSDEQRGAARIAAISALIVVTAFVAGKAARDAILLASFDIETLPIFIATSAVISLPIIILAGRLLTRYGPARLMPALNAASAVLSVVEWLLLDRFPRPVAVVVYFHLATSGAVLVSGFWSIVNERFDVQSAKRHIGRIGIGATLGGITGGLVAERTAVHLGPERILLVLAALQLICAVMLYLFGRGAPHKPAQTAPQETWMALRLVARSRLLRNVGAVIILCAVAAGVMDYVFRADIVAVASKDSLLRSLAIFYTVTNVITSIIQAAVCGPLIARLGVPRSVGTLPATITVFGALALAIPVPLAAAIARGAEAVTHNSIYRAGYELLYAPLPEEHKRPTKVVLDVGADRIGDVLGAQLVGAIVVLVAEPRAALLIATVAVGALAVLFATRLPRAYTQALEDSLLARAQEASAGALDAADEPEPWITLDGLPSLGQAGDCAPLSLRFRNRGLRTMPPFAQVAGSSQSGLRAMSQAGTWAAVGAAGASGATGAAGATGAEPAAGAPPKLSRRARRKASAEGGGRGHTEGGVRGHAESGGSGDRGHGTARNGRDRSAGHVGQGDRDLLDRIADLRSPDPDRVRLALAAGLTPELAPHAIDLLGRDDVAREALAALGAVAPRSTGLLVDALLDQDRDITVRRRLPGVLLAGSPALAAWGLWRALLDASFDVRYRSGAVLARLAADGHLGTVAADDVFGIVRRELLADRDALQRRVFDDFVAAAEQQAEDDPVLRRAGTGLEHVFTVLGLALPAEPLRIALHAVQTDDPELRGTALEYLESILPPDVRVQLWPLLEGEDGALASTPGPSLDESVPAVASVSLPPPPPPPGERAQRSPDEIVAALRMSYPSIVEKLRQRVKPA